VVKKLVWLAIGVGVAVVTITAALLFPLQTDTAKNRFISEAEAIQAAKEKYPFLEKEKLQTEFGYLKHEGLSNMYGETVPQISWYSAHPDSSLIAEILHANITLRSAPQELINEQKDRYVWTVIYYVPTSAHIVFIDAENGKVLGEYVPCPSCICYHS
jgi:hypothetical protein